MISRRLFKSIVALAVAAGLMFAPLAATAALAKADPSVGGERHAMDMHAMDAPATDMQAMADDMPCCPDEGKAGDCACPLVALCMLSISIPLPEAGALVTREALRNAFSTRDDAWVQGLNAHPPDHPPRTSV